MATQRHDGVTQPVVQTAGDVTAGHRPEVVVADRGDKTISLDVNVSTDGIGNASHNTLVVMPFTRVWNENAGNWQALRNNSQNTALVSASRTADTNSADITLYNARRLALIVDVSSAGTGSITPRLQVRDPVSGNYVTIWSAAVALTSNGTRVYLFGGGGESGGSFTETLAFGAPGRVARVQIGHNNANPITYSAALEMMV